MKPVQCSYRFLVYNILIRKVIKAFLLSVLVFLTGSFVDSFARGSTKKPILPPVAICKNISVQLGADGTVSITGSAIDGGSYDPDGTIVSLVVTPNSFGCSQLGTNTVTLTVTDDEDLSSSCSATVTVVDRMSPVILCRNHTVYLDGTGNAEITVSDINNGSYDNCTGLFMFLSRTEFNCLDIGSPVQVTLFGTDSSGNSSFCTSQITVLDTVSPVINVKPFNVILGSSGTATISPSDIDNGTFDNCSSVTLSVIPDNFSCIDQGLKTVVFTATDSYGNTSSRSVDIQISSDVKITSMSLSTCDLSPTLGLFSSDQEGGDGSYSYFWSGLDETAEPFMVIVPLPPSIQISNTSTSPTPFFNNSIPDGFYDIRLLVTDGNGCADSSEITINRTGAVVNNQTVRHSEACEGEVRTYSVRYEPDALYSWLVTNGTILSTETDTNRITVLWDLGVVQGRVYTTISEPNMLFTGGQCESTVIDSVAVIPVPLPVFTSPVTDVCSNSVVTYTLTMAYPFHQWSVTGGSITAGGGISDNYVSIRWGNGPVGTLMVQAGDNSICTGSVILNVTIFNLSGSISSVADISCNGGSDGAVSVDATPGTGSPPYEFSLDGGPFQSGGNFSGISLGNHSVTIRDALLCTFTIPFIINQPTPVMGILSSVSAVSCFGGSDGSATIDASGGTGPYQYSLNAGPFQSSNTFGGLPSGSYLITVQDSHGCTVNVPFYISQPVLPLDGFVIVTDVNCNGDATGRIDLLASGGTAPYTFLWNNGATSEDLINIPSGNYSVVITDNNGCTNTINATVLQPDLPLSGAAIVTDVLCFGESTGSVDLSASGGTPPYSFAWNNGAVTEDILNVSAGNYSVIITDSNGCTASVNATVDEPSTSVSAVISSQTNVSCNGWNDGSVTVSGTGGTGSYEYQLEAGSFQSSGTFGSLTAGAYNITVRDANLCTFVLSVSITEPFAPLSGSIASQTDVLCYGDATGTVTVNGSGGTPPYEFSIDGGDFDSSGNFGGLAAGVHNVIIRDSNLCTNNISVTITEPPTSLSGSLLSQTDVLCYGDETGTVNVSGTGGTSPYTYAIDGGPFQSTGLFETLGSGTHNIIIRDNNLCQFTLPVIIAQPSLPLEITIVSTNVSCMGGSTGSATATATGGTAPYTYIWNTIPIQTDPAITGLIAGIYSVTVTDYYGCTASSSVTITQPSAPLTLTFSVTDVSCFGGSDGEIDLTVTNGTSPFTFVWSNGASTEDIGGLTAGPYSVSVSDANGCLASGMAMVNQPEILEGTISVTDIQCNGESSGSCILTITGGTSPYTYIWNNGAVTKDITNIPAGTYSVSATDANGCNIVVSATLIQPDNPLVGSITSQTNVSVYGGNDGSVTVEASGGTPPYIYSLDSGTGQPAGTYNTLVAGTYTVTVTDAVMCSDDVTVIITQPSIPLTANIVSQTNVSCYGENNGSVTIEGWGGTQPYVYCIDGGPYQDSGTFNSLSAGNYIVTVRDIDLDLYDIDITVTEPEELVVAVTGTDNVCFGGNTGSATAIASGGTGPYIFEWNSDPVQSTATATGLPSGNYSVTVTDANGCSVIGNITISQPVEDMIVSITTINVLCSGGSTGSAAAVITGGQAPYLYSWDTSPEQADATATDLQAGTYTLTVTDANGCIKTQTVDLLEPQPLDIQYSSVATSCPDSDDGSINLEITGGTPSYQIIWSDNITTIDRTGLIAGSYSAVVTDQNGCASSITVEVDFNWSSECLVIQQIITPNNDGYNDEWKIKNIELYPDAEVRVFNRWGKMVFSTRNLADNPWDGRSDGILVPTDSYHYILYLNDGSEPRTGVISVIR